MHGDICKHLGIDSSTDHPDRYSNLFLNALSMLHSSLLHLATVDLRHSGHVIPILAYILGKIIAMTRT